MKRYLVKPSEVLLRDEAAMRAFYQSCGISSKTTEAAILVRRHKPYEETKPVRLEEDPAGRERRARHTRKALGRASLKR